MSIKISHILVIKKVQRILLLFLSKKNFKFILGLSHR